MNEKEREDLNEMCNWSMAHYLDGVDKGKIEGKAEGRIEGKLEGKNEEKHHVIHRLHDAGFPIEVIATAVALSTAEVLAALS